MPSTKQRDAWLLVDQRQELIAPAAPASCPCRPLGGEVLQGLLASGAEIAGRRHFRADAAFAKPEVYELLEAEDIRYAIRLLANQVLQERIGYLLKRPVGRPPKKPIMSYASFYYQAKGWTRARQVVATVESRVSSIPASASS